MPAVARRRRAGHDWQIASATRDDPSLQRIEELRDAAGERAGIHRKDAGRSLLAYFVMVGAATTLAGTGAYFGFHGNKTSGFCLAAAAAVVLLLETFFRPDSRARDHARAAVEYETLRNEAETLVQDGVRDERELRPLIARRDRLRAEAPSVDEGRTSWLEGHPAGLLPAVLAVAIAVAVGAAVEKAVETSTESTGVGGPTTSQPAPGSQLDHDLALQYAPILHLSRDELFAPIDRARYVQTTNVFGVKGKKVINFAFSRREPDLPDTNTCPKPCRLYLDVAGLRPRNGPACYSRLQDELLVPNVPAVGRARQAERRSAKRRKCPQPVLGLLEPPQGRPTVYWHAVPAHGPPHTIQYWFLYFFNGFENWHESDWEQITVRLADDDSKIQLFYSAHESGYSRYWPQTLKVGRRPRVFVGSGSHANYFDRGRYRVEVCVRGRCVRPPRPLDRADGCGDMLIPEGVPPPQPLISWTCSSDELASLGPRAYVLRELTTPRFGGDWARGNYILHAAIRVQDRGPEDPQLRSEWTNPLRSFDRAQQG